MEEIEGLSKCAAIYLHSAKTLIAEGDYNSAVSRIYYAMFYMTQACLFSQNIVASTIDLDLSQDMLKIAHNFCQTINGYLHENGFLT